MKMRILERNRTGHHQQMTAEEHTNRRKNWPVKRNDNK